ncbi:hypothetical protein [Geoglobus acetivorans]
MMRRELQRLAEKSPETLKFCRKVLDSERYGGNVILMVVDAAITSVGVNYFSVVVPRVLEFKRRFIDSGRIAGFDDLISCNDAELYSLWRNKRSWQVAKGVCSIISEYGEGATALRRWAKEAEVESWREWLDVKGAGINTFQYLRMMGGIDTVMPDRIVRRFVGRFVDPPNKLVEFVEFVESLSGYVGFGSTEICWLSWLSSYDDEKIRKYSRILAKI